MSSGKIKGSQGFNEFTSPILYFNQGLDNKFFIKKNKTVSFKKKFFFSSMKSTVIGIHGFYVFFLNKIRIFYKLLETKWPEPPAYFSIDTTVASNGIINTSKRKY